MLMHIVFVLIFVLQMLTSFCFVIKNGEKTLQDMDNAVKDLSNLKTIEKDEKVLRRNVISYQKALNTRILPSNDRHTNDKFKFENGTVEHHPEEISPIKDSNLTVPNDANHAKNIEISALNLENTMKYDPIINMNDKSTGFWDKFVEKLKFTPAETSEKKTFGFYFNPYFWRPFFSRFQLQIAAANDFGYQSGSHYPPHSFYDGFRIPNLFKISNIFKEKRHKKGAAIINGGNGIFFGSNYYEKS